MKDIFKVAEEFCPPKLHDEKATGNHAVDALGYSQFPHLFLELARRYEVPSEFLIVLLYLWDSTVGQWQPEDRKGKNRQGRIALSQFPLSMVRVQQRNKWLQALLSAGFFIRTELSGPAAKKGSLYEYDNATTVSEWVAFFAKAGMAGEWKGDKDDVSTATFAFMFRRRGLGLDRWKDKPEEPYLQPPPEKRKRLREFIARKKEAK
jgi:hypothetical protein